MPTMLGITSCGTSSACLICVDAVRGDVGKEAVVCEADRGRSGVEMRRGYAGIRNNRRREVPPMK